MAESFASALAATKPNRGGARSMLDQVRAQLSDKDRAAFDAALADPDVQGPQVHAALKAIGVRLSKSTVYRWCREARDV